MAVISSAMNVPRVGLELQQSNAILLHPQTQALIVGIQNPNNPNQTGSIANAIETLRLAQLKSNQALWQLTQGEHPIVSKHVEEGPNAPKFSLLA